MQKPQEQEYLTELKSSQTDNRGWRKINRVFSRGLQASTELNRRFDALREGAEKKKKNLNKKHGRESSLLCKSIWK